MKFIAVFMAVCILSISAAFCQSFSINGPTGSGQFGFAVKVLPNGNYVVTDPYYDDGIITDVGAAYLYNGSTHAQISMLKGSQANDRLGSSGIYVLSNGNYLTGSDLWDNGAAADAGAVTWGSATAGVSGIVSAANSLIGSTSGDKVGSGITVLTDGNYFVSTRLWTNGSASAAGAVTWGSGSTGVSGAISNTNSLVGNSAADLVGNSPSDIYLLPNGNYVLVNPYWRNGLANSVGAVTWCSGSTGITGNITNSNSMIGSTAGSSVGSGGIQILPNSNYIIKSPSWDNGVITDAGAVTWCNGSTGRTGIISSLNSLVGSTASDNVGTNITALANSNYVNTSSGWDNGTVLNAGAVTWCNGTSGTAGVISGSNSLIGSKANDAVGGGLIKALTNGNYVVSSTVWDNGAIIDAGAATFANGNTGVTGVITGSNSLIGGTANNSIGGRVIELTNGNYVIGSNGWDNGAATDAGAVTWGNGMTGVSGVVSSSNSLIGSTAADNVGQYIIPLSNGNYVLRNFFWDNGAIVNAGAATWCNGATGRSGIITSANSLIGSSTNDYVSIDGITALTNGNYIVRNGTWKNAGISSAGAATWCDGTVGRFGTISSANSLIGSNTGDNVGQTVVELTNGHYVIVSYNWNNGATARAGAITWCNGTTGRTGIVGSSNSLIGNVMDDQIGNPSVTPLPNGNYTVQSYLFDNGSIVNAGAVTWCNGNIGRTGPVTVSNSLVGTSAMDQVGNYGIDILTNGNYLVRNPLGDNGAITDAGAVTFCNGSTGITGTVSSMNSFMGSTASDIVGQYITILSNGNYLTSSTNWDNGAITNAGSITWGNGSTGSSGIVSNLNSIVGSSASDQIGNSLNIYPQSNGNYIVQEPLWDNGAVINAGAALFATGSAATTGIFTTCNSVIGNTANGGYGIRGIFNSVFDYTLVSRPSDNMVTVFNPTGMALANHLDIAVTDVGGLNAVPQIVNPGCRIISTVTPNGSVPVRGVVNSKAWIETGVPSFLGIPFLSRHFEITPASNAGTATGRIKLYCSQQEFDTFNTDPGSTLDLPSGPNDLTGKSNLKIGKYSGTTSDGSGLPGSYSGTNSIIDPADTDITWNSSFNRWEISFDVTGFSGFIIQTYATVLPVTLLEFSGRLLNDDSYLTWKTENEINTSSFTIERSTNVTHFKAIGSVQAANTAGIHLYNYTDSKISQLGVPVVYYRLKQMDNNGSFKYSPIVKLQLQQKGNTVNVYPNPVSDKFVTDIIVEKQMNVQAILSNSLGQTVATYNWILQTGNSTRITDVSKLAKGIYYLNITGDNGWKEQVKIVKH